MYSLKELELSGDVITCPHCGEENLHQKEVEIYFRDKEDSKSGTHVRVCVEDASIDKNMKKNPSLRRDGVTIEFYCESCEKISNLLIIQHKRRTFQCDRCKEPFETDENAICHFGAIPDDDHTAHLCDDYFNKLLEIAPWLKSEEFIL